LIDFVGAIVELYAFDAYGNAIGFDPSVALTEFLYSGEQFDSKIGQQYLRARYYDPATGRFNRLDPFFGNLNDPQSLHKYLYTHADPVNEIDPNGLFVMACMVVTNITTTNLRTNDAKVKSGVGSQTTTTLLSNTATYQSQLSNLTSFGAFDVYLTLKFSQFYDSHVQSQELTQTANQLNIKVKSVSTLTEDIENDRNRIYFIHGSSTKSWKNAVGFEIQPSDRYLDFGNGVYTFPATPEGYLRAAEWAERKAQKDHSTPFVLLASMSTTVYNQMDKKSYGYRYYPSPDYSVHVNMYRSGGDPNINHTYDVIHGPVAIKQSEIWVARKDLPEQ
jgi:RHS repeat-associated protein